MPALYLSCGNGVSQESGSSPNLRLWLASKPHRYSLLSMFPFSPSSAIIGKDHKPWLFHMGDEYQNSDPQDFTASSLFTKLSHWLLMILFYTEMSDAYKYQTILYMDTVQAADKKETLEMKNGLSLTKSLGSSWSGASPLCSHHSPTRVLEIC